MTNTIKDIRNEFAQKLSDGDYFQNTIEIIGASFIADEDFIFGSISEDYLIKELNWYKSMSLRVEDIGEPVPKIWQDIASEHGEINSNYGYLFLKTGQYQSVIKTLTEDKHSRRAVAIYTNPNMHEEWTRDGMRDFVCTNAVHYEIRDNKLNLVVQMRSNDAIFGYKNDYTWQRYTQMLMTTDLMRIYPLLKPGTITWQVASLHIYERHFYLVDHFLNTEELSVRKEDYEGIWSE